MHRNKRRRVVTLAATAGLLFVARAWAASPTDTVAVVDGTGISAEQLKVLEATRRIEHPSPKQRQELITGLVDRRLLAEQAEKAGLDKSEHAKALLSSARDTILARLAVQHYLVQHPVTDKELRSRYDTLIKHLPARQYKLRAIVARSQGEARQIEKQLRHGSGFAKLAKEHSLLSDKKAPGGELGWRFARDFVPPIATAIGKADKGKPSAPVWTPQGWWIVDVEAVRPTRHKPYEQASAAVRKLVVKERVEQEIAALRKQARVKVVSGN